MRANVRVAAAANDDGRDPAMHIAFRTGGMVGMATVGLGLLGASVVVLLFKDDAPHVLEGFGFGAALLAMFMRVGGGIFTKAADVGADLVGKVEQGIPEDDPRNAATIADNVGDNVGDCAGMAADLFESYAVTLVAALILGSQAFGDKGLVFPLIVPAIGALTAVVGVYISRPRAGENGLTTINRAFYISAAISAVACVDRRLRLPARASFAELRTSPVATWPAPRATRGSSRPVAVVIGIVLAAGILALTGYFTGTDHRPVKDVGQTSLTGAGHGHPVRPRGRLRVGGLHRAGHRRGRVRRVPARRRVADGRRCSRSRWPAAACSPRSASSSRWTPSARSPTTPRASRRCPATSAPRARRSSPSSTPSATPPRRSPRASRSRPRCWRRPRCSARTRPRSPRRCAEANPRERRVRLLTTSSVFNPNVLVGVLLGAAVVFLFSGLAINAVGRAAGAVVFEVRRQFREIPGIMEGTGRPEYGKVVDIVTRDSLRELATPGLLAVLAPVAVGFGLGVGPLAGFLAGAIGAGTLMAVFLANSGGAWDNAKKLVEDGHHGGKGSLAHEATIIGDTVGDPFKDTAGPAINPLIKVMNLVSLLIAGAVVAMSVGDDENDPLRIGIALVAVAIIAVAVYISKQREVAIGDDDSGQPAPPPPPAAPVTDPEPAPTQQFEPTQHP